MAQPSIILLDECTSGLDAAAALGIVTNLVDLSRKGLAVITTIHQPSSEIWELLDMLMLLVEGHMVYFGDARSAIPYFANLGLVCPPYVNPADFVIRLINREFPGHADVDALIAGKRQIVMFGQF